MMVRALLILSLLCPLQAWAECITVTWTARDFLGAKTDAARAVGQSQDTLRVITPLFGKNVRKGDIVRIQPFPCRSIVPGVEYFIATACTSASPCEWGVLQVKLASGFEEYARARHAVTRPEVMKKLRQWQARKLTTEAFRRWLSTADARDSIGSFHESLVLAVIERVEDLLDFAAQAETCNPADAAWLREHGAEIFLERFARLPKQHTRSEWLDSPGDANDEWYPKELQSDLEFSLESARSWEHTIDCFLRKHPEVSK